MCLALTFETIGSFIEVQLEDIIRGAVAVQGPRQLPAADEAEVSTEHNDWPVDELQHELFSLT